MARRLKSLEDELTCSICFEVFSEPVTLPCKHSYCRDCLQELADNTDSLYDQLRNGVDISCPQCRAETNLGKEGVTSLPLDIELTKGVLKAHNMRQSKESLRLCSTCDDGSRARAAKYCSICSLMYCEKCSTALHPMTGIFKHHTVIPIEEHISNSKEGVSNIDSAIDELKEMLARKTRDCEEAHTWVEVSLSALRKLEEEIKFHEGLHIAEIVKAYHEALSALDSWRDKCLKEIERSHAALYSQCRAAAINLEKKQEALEKLVGSSRDISAEKHIKFLQEVKQVDLSIDNQLFDIDETVKGQNELIRKLKSALKLDPAVPRKMSVEEICVRPTTKSNNLVKFTRTSGRGLTICDNGSVVDGRNLKPREYCTAWTGGRIPGGEVSWGVEITVPRSSGYSVCQCLLGVTHEDCGLYVNPGRTSWYFLMEYSQNKVWCHRTENPAVNVKSPYDKSTPYAIPHRLGLTLNWDDHTLTVTDCESNKIMATVLRIDLSKPVVPAVGFMFVWSSDSVTARLFPWEGSG